MLLKRQSILTGQAHSMELPITIAQLNKWEGGGLIQEVFPDLTPAQREFIMTGVTEHEWDDAFGGE
tara:strand:+ start:266 stop:463 length:198 start_codon:yes stop_codon:yes gene_type:complete